MFYDAGKIFTGLAIFLVGATFPFWYAMAAGKTAYKPEPVFPTSTSQCVESTEQMIAGHMEILDDWRNEVVRRSDREPIEINGTAYPKSLSRGCGNCHADQTQFCDRCHEYAGVSPYCWECHVEGD